LVFNVFSATYPLTWTKDAAKLTLFIDRSLKGLVSYKAVSSFYSELVS